MGKFNELSYLLMPTEYDFTLTDLLMTELIMSLHQRTDLDDDCIQSILMDTFGHNDRTCALIHKAWNRARYHESQMEDTSNGGYGLGV